MTVDNISIISLGEFKNSNIPNQTLLDLERVVFFNKMPDAYNNSTEYLLDCHPMSPIAMNGDKPVGFYFIQFSPLLIELIRIVDAPSIPKDVLQDIYPLKWEGVSLGVLPEYKGRGIGTLLKEEARDCFGRLWGGADERLGNLEYWLKSRKLIATHRENGHKIYTTAELK